MEASHQVDKFECHLSMNVSYDYYNKTKYADGRDLYFYNGKKVEFKTLPDEVKIAFHEFIDNAFDQFRKQKSLE